MKESVGGRRGGGIARRRSKGAGGWRDKKRGTSKGSRERVVTGALLGGGG